MSVKTHAQGKPHPIRRFQHMDSGGQWDFSKSEIVLVVLRKKLGLRVLNCSTQRSSWVSVGRFAGGGLEREAKSAREMRFG